MKKIYKAHILYTKERNRFEVLENGYIAVENGIVKGVSTNFAELKEQCSIADDQRSTDINQWQDVEMIDSATGC